MAGTPRDEGGNAFPFNERSGDGSHFHSHVGMTLRDWFAGQALAGMLANPEWAPTPGQAPERRYAVAAYIQADCMLAERAKGGAK